MVILRKSNKERYTTIPMNIIRDERLSLKDIGLLISMLSLPDNWEFSENGLETLYKNDGITSIRTGLKKLENCGYLKRTRIRNKNGTLKAVEWFLYDYPKLDYPQLENPRVENPNVENPRVENQPQYNTKEYNTKKYNTKEYINISPKDKKAKKTKYGEYKNVLLSDEEYQKLQDRFSDVEAKIKELDEGIELKGYKYKSHYLAIIKWSEKRKGEKKEKDFAAKLGELPY